MKTSSRGYSTKTGKRIIKDYILKYIPRDNTILDVGFGSGTYGRLLKRKGYHNIDGVDIYPEDIGRMGLKRFYRNIFISDILQFQFKYYDLIILGDILEHLLLEDAQLLLKQFTNKAGHIIVSIPFEFPQGPTENPNEEHLQDNVTPGYMERFYPDLKLFYAAEMMEVPGKIIGIYIWRNDGDG
jgi:SAM-dependent methyltransferase